MARPGDDRRNGPRVQCQRGHQHRPVHAIGRYSGVTTKIVGGHIGFADLVGAYGDIVADGRFLPTVCWASQTTYKTLRLETDAAGMPLFERSEAMLLDVRANGDGSLTRVPIVPLRGFAGQGAIIADAKQIFAVHRPVAGSLLVRVDRADQTDFSHDRASFRLIRRIDFGIAPGHEAAVTALSVGL